MIHYLRQTSIRQGNIGANYQSPGKKIFFRQPRHWDYLNYLNKEVSGLRRWPRLVDTIVIVTGHDEGFTNDIFKSVFRHMLNFRFF